MKSLDISKTIPEDLAGVLVDVASFADRIGIRIVILGATARDLLLSHGHGVETRRMTRDVDVCIEINRWERFHEFREALIQGGRFDPHPALIHSLVHTGGIPLDVVPFGGIESEARSIAWPPDGAIRMNTLGLREATASTVRLRVQADPDRTVEVLSLPALVALKLISWRDRGMGVDKDGIDLAILLEAYGEIGEVQDRLYGADQGVLEAEDFDLTLGGCRLLGRDVAEAIGSGLCREIAGILRIATDEAGDLALASQMAKASRPVGDREEAIEWCRGMLVRVLAGMGRGLSAP